ncbi:MAG: GIY-YIG nuclease family protein [Patescibacteria group bacterium]
MYYVYVLKSQKDKRLHIGYTNDLRRCMEAHRDGKIAATKDRMPLELVYYEAYKSVTDARKREKDLKLFGSSYSRLKRKINNSIKDKIKTSEDTK